MPAAFDSCVKLGGYIKTIQKGSGKYQRTCSRLGKVHKGEIKKKKKTS